MAATIRQQIFTALLTRAATVAPAQFADPSYVPEELPAVTIWEQTDEGSSQTYGQTAIETPVSFEAFEIVALDATYPEMMAQGNDLLGRLQAAVLGGDITLGDLCNNIEYVSGGVTYPADGETTLGASMTVRVVWSFATGDPWSREE